MHHLWTKLPSRALAGAKKVSASNNGRFAL